jgi:2'-5' RNA ligase
MERLRPAVRGVRWVRPDGVHLTLRFLGWTTPGALARFEEEIAPAVAACPAGVAAVGPVGMFPDRGSPRVLWVRLDCPPDVVALQAACERAAVHAGFEPEPRAFRPHVTIGRWKERAARPSLPQESLGTSRLDRVVLFRSELHKDGAVYTPLRTFMLDPLPEGGGGQ